MTHTVTLDSETTHLDPAVGHWWELALIAEDHPLGAMYDGEWVLTRPFITLDGADPGALRIAGFYARCAPLRLNTCGLGGDIHVRGPAAFTTEWVDSRPNNDERAEALAKAQANGEWVDERNMAYVVATVLAGAVIVGCRPEFDLPFISKWLAEHGHHLAADYHTIDVAQATLGRFPHILRNRKYRSDDLAALMDVEPPPPTERHTALGDARWARRWLTALEGAS